MATAASADEPRHLDASSVITIGDARSRCAAALIEPGARCTIGVFSRIGAVEGHEFFYARYDFSPAPDNKINTLPYTRVVIFQSAPSSMLLPILISSDDAAFLYGKPRLLHSAGKVLLHIPAAEDGTGDFNREQLYVWEHGGWRDVDVTSWLDELKRRLPKGLDALKGIFPDYVTMKAGTPIWHAAADSNACPTAGHVDIALAWFGDRIVLAGVRLTRSGKALNNEGCFE